LEENVTFTFMVDEYAKQGTRMKQVVRQALSLLPASEGF
jgi:hypothetical protein